MMKCFINNKGYLFLLLLSSFFLLSSCVDYNNASKKVNIKIQIAAPDEYKVGEKVGVQEVKIKSTSIERTAMTDENGLVEFSDCMPDVYNISVSWELTDEEYTEKTGSESSVGGYIVTATVSEKVLNESLENSTVQIKAVISMKTPLVISKIYSSGSKAYPEKGGKNYMSGKYLEIYNQTDKPIDVAGLYIGLLDSTNPIPWTLSELINDPEIHGSKVVVKQVFRIPTDKPYILEGGQSIVLTNSAVDHSDVSDFEQNLTNSDFEAVGINDKLEHNPDVPKLIPAYTSSGGATIMNLVQGGPCGIIIFETDEDVTTWQKTYGYGKTSGTQVYLLVPKTLIKDGVDFLKNRAGTGPDLSTKRLYSEIDAGCTHINAINGYTGEVVYRKTARVTSDGRKILRDTNNSNDDFKVSTTTEIIKVREYDDAE